MRNTRQARRRESERARERAREGREREGERESSRERERGDDVGKLPQARRVVIRPEDSSDKYNVDGEVLDGEKMEIEVLPRKLRMV